MSVPTLPNPAPVKTPRVRPTRRRNGLRRYLLTLETYHRAVEAGAFADDPHVELIKGELVRTVSETPSHATLLEFARSEIVRAFALVDCCVRAQHPISLPPNSEPEPDIYVARGTNRDYLQRHPGPADVLLMVEISDSTLATDRSVKAPLYAEAGIAEYWILDLNTRALEVYRNPVNGAYPTPTRHDETATILPLAAPNGATPIMVANLLP